MKYKIYIYIYFVLITAVFMVLVPPFEAPDEQFHLQYINFISSYHSLPDQYEGLRDKEKYVGQGHQYPLYYILTGIFNYLLNSKGVIPFTEFPNKKHEWNGGTEGKVPVFSHVYNTVFQSGEDKILFYTIRLFSVLFSLLTLYFIFKITALFFANKAFVLFTGIFTATLPQFIFISSVINNDALANFVSTICIYLMLKIFINPGIIKNYVYTGITLGIALITKKTLFFLISAFIFIQILILMSCKGNRLNYIKYTIGAFVIAAFLSGWFFIRNRVIYGDFLAVQMELDTMQSLIDMKSLFSSYFILQFFPNITRSFFAAFGWMNLVLPRYIYIYYTFLLFITIYGLIAYFLKYKLKNRLIIFSLIFIFSCLAGIIYFNLTFNQYQGRYMFPVISLIAVAVSFGLQSIIRRFKLEKYQNRILAALTASFVIINIISLYTIYKFYYTASQYL